MSTFVASATTAINETRAWLYALVSGGCGLNIWLAQLLDLPADLSVLTAGALVFWALAVIEFAERFWDKLEGE